MRWVTPVVALAFDTENLCYYSLFQITTCDLRKLQAGLFSNNEQIDEKDSLKLLSDSDFIKKMQLVYEIAFVTQTHVTHTFQTKNGV